jgi:hypothetical protein
MYRRRSAIYTASVFSVSEIVVYVLLTLTWNGLVLLLWRNSLIYIMRLCVLVGLAICLFCFVLFLFLLLPVILLYRELLCFCMYARYDYELWIVDIY